MLWHVVLVYTRFSSHLATVCFYMLVFKLTCSAFRAFSALVLLLTHISFLQNMRPPLWAMKEENQFLEEQLMTYWQRQLTKNILTFGPGCTKMAPWHSCSALGLFWS
jgi:hypothetical protein